MQQLGTVMNGQRNLTSVVTQKGKSLDVYFEETEGDIKFERHRLYRIRGAKKKDTREGGKMIVSWHVPRIEKSLLVSTLLEDFGDVKFRLPLSITISTTTQCDTRCREAEKDECVCSCGGQYHGDNSLLDSIRRKEFIVADTVIIIVETHKEQTYKTFLYKSFIGQTPPLEGAN